MPRYPTLPIAIVAVWAFLLSACGGSDASGVTFGDAWSRQPAPGQPVAAVFGVLRNPLDHEVVLTAVSSPVSDRVEIHESVMGDDGAMSMRELADGVSVPAGSSLDFKPGGAHIMLFDVDAATYPSDVVEMTLEFSDGTNLAVQAEVRSLVDDATN